LAEAALGRRLEREQKAAEAEERRHSSNDALYASGEAAAEAFLAKSPRAYDLDQYRRTPSPESRGPRGGPGQSGWL